MHGVRPPDGVGVHLAEADPADLAIPDELRDGGDGFLEGHIGVDAAGGEDVDFLAAVEDAQAFGDAAADVGTGAVHVQALGRVAAAFEGEADAGGGGGVRGEEAGEQVQGVGVWRAVELGPVPERDVVGEGGGEGVEGLGVGDWGRPPSEVSERSVRFGFETNSREVRGEGGLRGGKGREKRTHHAIARMSHLFAGYENHGSGSVFPIFIKAVKCTR